MIALLLAAAEPHTVIAAERAFAADAQRLGQWTAFRRWAAAEATMFVPQPMTAQAWLKDRRDPSAAIRWSPTQAWIACDGRWAVDTGEWRRPDGPAGYFTTVWRKASDGRWRWLVDGGDSLATARPPVARPPVHVASCGGAGRANGYGLDFGQTGGSGFGASGDATLRWRYHVDTTGARRLVAEVWNGRGYHRVINDQIAAPAP